MVDFTELTEAELDELIARVKEAVEHNLALSVEDMQLLLNALMTLAHLQERLAETDITLHKLRKLAGIVSASEKLKDIVPNASPSSGAKKKKSKPSKPPQECVIHQRCKHAIEGLEKGQRCPECERGTLYKYEPAMLLRISGQTPLISTQHLLERLRCNTCGAYYTADLPEAVQQDGPPGQQYGYSARALMAIQRYFAGAPFYRQQTLQQLLGMSVGASTVFDQCEQLANALQALFVYLMTLSGNAIPLQCG